MEEEAIKAAAETDKPVNDPVKEKIREFIVGKDLGKLRQYEVYFQLYPDQVTPRMFQEAWQSVMNEQPEPPV